MQEKNIVLSYYPNEEEIKADCFFGILISLIPPYDEKEKIIMIEEYLFGDNEGIIGTIIIDGVQYRNNSKSKEELETKLLKLVVENLKKHSYEIENPLQIMGDINLQYWIEESFNDELKNWKETLKIQ